MKASFALSVAFTSVVSALWHTFGTKQCTNAYLTGGPESNDTYTLHVDCPSGRLNYTLTLDSCFANYDGNLTHVANGGFSSSCFNCSIPGTGSHLVCGCSPMNDPDSLKQNKYLLDDPYTLQFNPADEMVCDLNVDIKLFA
ncbi:hypothetical protein GGR53DRAFT_479515 [Hypoxylon sp. FL1150]|nr:hypothetical protein GGR53DRAFT_479515 [Hypoxylon sp. FL1150]